MQLRMKNIQLGAGLAALPFAAAALLGCSNPGGSAGGEGAEVSVRVVENVTNAVPEQHVGLTAVDPLEGDAYSARAGECCSGPGQVMECWLADAEDDGVTCKKDRDCPSNSCDTDQGLCVCASDDDCNDGVCTDENLCGPSWCNGYRQCSCWGGCDRVGGERSYDVLCAANNQSCCEGLYPIDPDARDNSKYATGYCTSCDDGNPCTDDLCNGAGGCLHEPNTDACDDENVCTQNDVCAEGRCEGMPTVCSDGNVCTDDRCVEGVGCVFEDNTNSCDDGDACTTNEQCEDGVCGGGDARECDDGNPCTDERCDSKAGCVYIFNTGACDDGNACTAGEVCKMGVCGFGAAVDCSDGNVCTDVTCDPRIGCVVENNDNACDDGNACTTGDVCGEGACVGIGALNCDDGNVCTTDSCNPASGCAHVNNTIACDDGNACSFGDVCSNGLCVSTPIVCNDSNTCTDDLCGVNGCRYVENEATCTDGNPCSGGDHCSGGTCSGTIIYWRFEETDVDQQSGAVYDWAGNYPAQYENDAYTTENGKKGSAGWFGPGNGSNVGMASTSYHVYENSVSLAMWVKFEDVNAGEQVIGSSSGAGKRFYLGIDGGNQIFAGYGNAFVGKSHPSVPSGIQSGVWVRMAMSFDGEKAHVYVNGVELISFDARFVGEGEGPEFFLGTGIGNVTIDEVVISEEKWDQSDVNSDYDNGNGPNPYRYVADCDDDNPCTDDSCDSSVGCVHTPNTDSCDDGNPCTTNDACIGGVCSGTTSNCNDGNVCTTDSCDPLNGGCMHANNTLACDDGNACTGPDVCGGGACTGQASVCNDNNSCTTDTCNTSTGCRFTANTNACNDNNVCTTSDTCSAGTCKGTIVNCDDGDECTTDTCNATTGCVHTSIVPCHACDDVSDCEGMIACDTQPDGCSSLACNGGECECETVPENTTCTGYDIAEYPPNCYEGLCDADGACRPVMGAADNNLCSDLFEVGDRSVVDTTSSGWLGAFTNTQTSGILSATGSTLCANNNYYAGGDECTEHSTANQIGYNGPDLVYAFEYQTGSATQFELYSYIVKVQADFDVGMYIKTDIANASFCPEGDVPDFDSHEQTYLQVSSAECAHPYQDSPMPPVVEDECSDNGNTLYGQDCCDPCMDGSSCGYKWCKRGYKLNGASCDICKNADKAADYDSNTFLGDCDAAWYYPEDPYDCSSEVPDDPGYDDYDYKASAVISPDGSTDGSTRKAFIFIDGVTSAKGNFYLTVEKRRWWAGPCDRVDDDARVYDITHVGASGETFQGTLEGVVNSVHSGTGSCGGYSCTGNFSGKSACHPGDAANQFWPNQETFKIRRAPGEGDSTYCIMTDESISGGADLVMSIKTRSDSSALTICDESYSVVGCAHNSSGSNISWEFTVDENKLYLVEVSQYAKINRVCTPSQGDSCRYKFTIKEGACPASCVAPSTWYGGTIQATQYTVNGANFSPDALVDGSTASTSNAYDPGTGWNAEDTMFQINVTADSRVRFSGCNNGGYGAKNHEMAIFDCEGRRITWDNDSCGWYGMPKFAVELSTLRQPYYLIVDGYDSSDKGGFGIGLSYQ